MTTAQQLLQGAYDLHIHSGPCLIKRSVTHREACIEAYNAGLAGVLLKDQHGPTYHVSKTLEECLQFERPFSVFGGLVIGNSTGGLNPAAVENAIEYGAKAIWMPTLAADFNRNYHKTLNAAQAATMPKSTSRLKYDPNIALLDSCGQLKQEVKDIVKLAADANIMIGNGHVSQRETDELINAAKAAGSKKIVINHPELQLQMTLDQMRNYTQAQVYLEHVLAIVYSNKSSHPYIYEMIKATGTEYVMVNSDLGQVGRPHPMEGLENFVTDMLDLGLSHAEITAIIKDNQAKMMA